MRVLLIHGRAQGGKDPVALKQEWLGALRAGFERAGRPWPAGVQFDFPFYGDKLDELVAQNDLPDTGDIVPKGPAELSAFERFARDVLIEIQESHPALDEASIRAEFPAEPVGEKGPENWAWVHGIAKFIDRRWTGAAEFTIERFLKDVHLYVNSRYVRRQIDEIVSAMVTDEPTVVVGHSLGSVVSYNLIRAPNAGLNAVKHVTVGSPLGLTSISSQLGIPVNTARDGWFNAFDDDDIVALHPLDADRFGTRPAIENHGGVDNHTPNQHGITGYLNDRLVAERIADAVDAST